MRTPWTSETWGRSSGRSSDLPRERMSSSLLNWEAQPCEDLAREPELAEEGVLPLAEELPEAADELGVQMSCQSRNWAACCSSSCSFPPLADYPLLGRREVPLYWARWRSSRPDCFWKLPLAAREETGRRGKMQGSVLWQ